MHMLAKLARRRGEDDEVHGVRARVRRSRHRSRRSRKATSWSTYPDACTARTEPRQRAELVLVERGL